MPTYRVELENSKVPLDEADVVAEAVNRLEFGLIDGEVTFGGIPRCLRIASRLGKYGPLAGIECGTFRVNGVRGRYLFSYTARYSDGGPDPSALIVELDEDPGFDVGLMLRRELNTLIDKVFISARSYDDIDRFNVAHQANLARKLGVNVFELTSGGPQDWHAAGGPQSTRAPGPRVDARSNTAALLAGGAIAVAAVVVMLTRRS